MRILIFASIMMLGLISTLDVSARESDRGARSGSEQRSANRSRQQSKRHDHKAHKQQSRKRVDRVAPNPRMKQAPKARDSRPIGLKNQHRLCVGK